MMKKLIKYIKLLIDAIKVNAEILKETEKSQHEVKKICDYIYLMNQYYDTGCLIPYMIAKKILHGEWYCEQ